jgi:GNAT superfamily N-acetyltransferase
MASPKPSRIAAALQYLDNLRRQIASTQGMAVPDEYGQRFGAPGEPVPSMNQVGQSVRGAAERMTSLNAPEAQSAGDTALDIAAGFTPLQYPQAYRDFERSRRTGDKLGMGLATLAAVPFVGGLSKAAGEARAAAKGIEVELFAVSNRPNTLHLSKIVVPKEQRGKGVGSGVMAEITSMADAEGKTITLTPSTDFGATSANRLKDFYKRFGFVENKGRNKDFTIRESMYRLPQKQN